jgi:hypothetical protein
MLGGKQLPYHGEHPVIMGVTVGAREGVRPVHRARGMVVARTAPDGGVAADDGGRSCVCRRAERALQRLRRAQILSHGSPTTDGLLGVLLPSLMRVACPISVYQAGLRTLFMIAQQEVMIPRNLHSIHLAY